MKLNTLDHILYTNFVYNKYTSITSGQIETNCHVRFCHIGCMAEIREMRYVWWIQ